MIIKFIKPLFLVALLLVLNSLCVTALMADNQSAHNDPNQNKKIIVGIELPEIPLPNTVLNQIEEYKSLLASFGLSDKLAMDSEDLVDKFYDDSYKISEKDTDIIFEKGMDLADAILDIKNNPGLHSAFDKLTDKELLKKIKKSKDINVRNSKGQTPLMIGVKSKSREVIEALLNSGADVNAVDSMGDTALIIASYKKRSEIVQLLLDRGADSKIHNKRNYSALLYAAERKKVKCVELLINNGADIEFKNNEGETPLILATEQGNPSVLTVLLKAGANVNAQDNFGQTPLMIAAFHGKEEIVTLLLNHDADPTLQTKKNNYTALRYAFEQNHTNVVKVLSKRNDTELQKILRKDLASLREKEKEYQTYLEASRSNYNGWSEEEVQKDIKRYKTYHNSETLKKLVAFYRSDKPAKLHSAYPGLIRLQEDVLVTIRKAKLAGGTVINNTGELQAFFDQKSKLSQIEEKQYQYFTQNIGGYHKEWSVLNEAELAASKARIAKKKVINAELERKVDGLIQDIIGK